LNWQKIPLDSVIMDWQKEYALHNEILYINSFHDIIRNSLIFEINKKNNVTEYLEYPALSVIVMYLDKVFQKKTRVIYLDVYKRMILIKFE